MKRNCSVSFSAMLCILFFIIIFLNSCFAIWFLVWVAHSFVAGRQRKKCPRGSICTCQCGRVAPLVSVWWSVYVNGNLTERSWLNSSAYHASGVARVSLTEQRPHKNESISQWSAHHQSAHHWWNQRITNENSSSLAFLLFSLSLSLFLTRKNVTF